MMFSEVTALDYWDEASIGSLKIIATPPDDGAQEAGFLVIEGEQVIWNAVDTFPSQETLIQLHERFPKLDLAILPWQPLQDVQFASGQGVSFPFAMYARAFTNALQLNTRAVVAGSCGFRVMGGYGSRRSCGPSVARAHSLLCWEAITASAWRPSPAWTSQPLVCFTSMHTATWATFVHQTTCIMATS